MSTGVDCIEIHRQSDSLKKEAKSEASSSGAYGHVFWLAKIVKTLLP